MRMHHHLSAPRRAPDLGNARGFSLIEVLVSVLVFALGMLGIAAMQATALRNSQSGFERSQGVMYTYSIVDAMRANRAVAIIGGYDLTVPTCLPPDVGTTLASIDLNNWIASLQANLGATACGQIACNGTTCEVRVQWDDSRGSAGDNTHTVVTRTRI